MSKPTDWINQYQTELLAKPPSFSFEFFPPHSEALGVSLWQSLLALAPFQPEFVSVTYGAGGSTRERTHGLVKKIREETNLEPAAHLTCVGSSKDEIRKIAEDYWNAGIKHIVALRGDPPKGVDQYEPHPDGYAYADSLVAGLKDVADFEISVAAYPEAHPEAESLNADIEHLKRKVDAGATRAITQYFFNLDHYLRFMDKVDAAGITIPITPGILAIGNYKQMVRFSGMCGASVPDWVHDMFADLEYHPEIHKMMAVALAAEQAKLLVQAGAEHLHFYTLNRADLVIPICRLLGAKPKS
ncbi:MAG: methylenetetrahydrofolate reductase [NAD(P)H] [Rickettsiales bacterium]|nr:methylenetetrahydrofolate reductase [NAD(P)H] [Rickettsiales bacterium]